MPPWFKYLFLQAGLSPSWIPKEGPLFFAHYYYNYFGREIWLVPILLAAPFLYAVHVYRNRKAPLSLRGNPLQLSTLFITISVVVPYTVLYLRSVFYSPVLYIRYTTITLPGLFVMVAYGINAIRR